MSDRRRILAVIGTRPEGIKTLPLVNALENRAGFDVCTVTTGQHGAILDQVFEVFGVEPSHNLDVMRPGQGLSQLFARVLEKLDPVLDTEQPDAIVVQGDTTTSTAAALAAFHRGIPIVHLEAGLRTATVTNPFPEEANRRLTSRLAALHLAPTQSSRENLEREAVPREDIVVTGNTVIDALLSVAERPLAVSSPATPILESASGPVVLVTTHRRESWGTPMRNIAHAVARLAREHPNLTFLWPLHPNPIVRDAVLPIVGGLPQVHAIEPLSYHPFVHARKGSTLVLTDSGGVQEEAPSLGKPVLVMRDNTERPEAVVAGAARLVGTDEDRIVDEVSRLITDSAHYEAMARAINPYGDGAASDRAVAAIAELLGRGERVEDFAPQVPC